MIHRLHSILACLLMSAALPAQKAKTSPTPSPQMTVGWLIELLDRDQTRALSVYRAASLSEDNSAADQRIARLRIAELERLRSPTRTSRNRPATGPGATAASRNAAARPSLREEFGAALAAPAGAERDRRLAALRDRLRAPRVQREPRPYLEDALRQLREVRNSTLAQLGSAIAKARSAEDWPALRRLSSQRYRLSRPALPRERLDQINRRPLAVIAQRYLQGKTQAAQSMTRILRGRRFRGMEGLNPSPLPPETEHRKLLTEARRRLGKHLREADLSAFESQVLEHLQARLAELDADGRAAEASALLARMPYYGNLFLK